LGCLSLLAAASDGTWRGSALAPALRGPGWQPGLQPAPRRNKPGGKQGAFNPVLQTRSEMKAAAPGHSVQLGQSSDLSAHLPRPHPSPGAADLGQVGVCSSSPFASAIAPKYARVLSSAPCRLSELGARSWAGGHEPCASREGPASFFQPREGSALAWPESRDALLERVGKPRPCHLG